MWQQCWWWDEWLELSAQSEVAYENSDNEWNNFKLGIEKQFLISSHTISKITKVMSYVIMY